MVNSGKINSIVENLRRSYQQEYGVAVFDIDLKENRGGVELRGEVLTESQRDDIINVLKKIKKNIVKKNVKVLADARERNEIGWAFVKAEIADLKLRFASNKILNEKILKRIRCSQAFKGEILRILYKNEDQLLVQQSDLTLGWVNRNEIVIKKMSSSPDKGRLRGVRKRQRLDLYKKWKSGNYAIKNKTIKTKISIYRIIKEAEKYLGASYVLGGKSKNGIDCSGLVQVAYKNSLNIILPKHSWDQKEMGRKVKLEDVKIGDLVFLIKKSNKHKHIGIVEMNNENTNLIHASLDKKKVIKQDLDEVLKNYEFVEARRIVT